MTLVRRANSSSDCNRKKHSTSSVTSAIRDSRMTIASTTLTPNATSSSPTYYSRCHSKEDVELTVPIEEEEDEDVLYAGEATRSSTAKVLLLRMPCSLMEEIVTSAELLLSSKINVLLIFAPLALLGDVTGWVAPSLCFVFAAAALIPCAERLSFVTEQVAEHTNESFGALLNATFGNAPELLISYAALRAGYYRVVQLTLLGSILCNLLLVFGVSCVVGGYKHSVQELRMTSGNVSIGMLFIATAGLLLPAALKLSNQEAVTASSTKEGSITYTELQYSRINSLFMIAMYVGYLFFQLYTHKGEFEDTPPSSPKPATPHRLRNTDIAKSRAAVVTATTSDDNDEEQFLHSTSSLFVPPPQCPTPTPPPYNSLTHRNVIMKSLLPGDQDSGENTAILNGRDHPPHSPTTRPATAIASEDTANVVCNPHPRLMTFRVGILWLFIITICISAMSDIIVDTINAFAIKVHFSEVFISLIVVPFFSNIAEQTSSILFAYRNEMDLCLGITVGSAIQISLFVLPGSVLIGWVVGRSMTLFFRGFETASLLMGVLTVTAVLQGGTSNWLTGLFCIGVYGMIAVGFWFHQAEDLSIDEEILLRNETFLLR
mmetsp:Transcript_18102/g.25771  ORF Transcript_18102/g.25771 Transcript_18102/m.25771 type:complete len:603 (-) Transcript_18102:201-2009(-)